MIHNINILILIMTHSYRCNQQDNLRHINNWTSTTNKSVMYHRSPISVQNAVKIQNFIMLTLAPYDLFDIIIKICSNKKQGWKWTLWKNLKVAKNQIRVGFKACLRSWKLWNQASLEVDSEHFMTPFNKIIL